MRRDQQRGDEADQGADDLRRRGLFEDALEPQVRLDGEQRRGERQRCGSGGACGEQGGSRDGGVLGEHARGAGEDEDAVEHAEDETDAGADDPRERSAPVGWSDRHACASQRLNHTISAPKGGATRRSPE